MRKSVCFTHTRMFGRNSVPREYGSLTPLPRGTRMPRLTPSRSAIAVVLLAALAFASSAFSAVTVQIDCTAPNLTPITFAAEIGETVTFQMTSGGDGPGCDDGGGWEFGNGNGLYYGADANVTQAGYMTLVNTDATGGGPSFRYDSDWFVWANSSGGSGGSGGSEDASINTVGETTITTTLGATDGAGTTLVPGATVAEIDTASDEWNTSTGVQYPIVWIGPPDVIVPIDCSAPSLTPITFSADIGDVVEFQMANPSCDRSDGWEFGNGNGLYYGADANVTQAGYMTLIGHNGSQYGNSYLYSSDWFVWANASGQTTITTTLGATDGAGTRLVPGATVAEIDTALSSWNTETGVQNPIVWRGPRTTAPTAPVSVTAVAGDASAVVSWSAPESDGGSAITGYTVTARPGGATCEAVTTTCTVTGLSNGTAYTVSVIARNEIGPSPASADSAPVTPSAAESPASKETGRTSTTLTPSVYLSQSQRRNGILVRFGGDVRITLQCPVAGAACAMTGTFTTTSPAARSGMSSFATTTTLASFKNVRVPAGSTKAITVRLFPTPLHYLQANGVTTIGAVLTVRRTLGSAITSSSQKVRLRIPRVHMAVTG